MGERSAVLAELGIQAPRAGAREDEVEEQEAVEDRGITAIERPGSGLCGAWAMK